MTIAIVGLGLIGTSVAMAARRAWPDVSLIQIERNQSLEPAAGADIVALAMPIDAIIGVLRHHARTLGQAVIVDTGSTKRAILAAAREVKLANFVGGHPMAGAAMSGPAGARADLFDDKLWFLVPHGANGAAVAEVRSFVEALGARPLVLDDDGSEHDRVMAAVSHLPQIVASALMTEVAEAAGEQSLSWAAGGLRDTTRLASSRVDIWRSIVATNADEIRPLLERLASRLQAFAGDLHDPAAVERLFRHATRHRAALDGTTGPRGS